MINWVDATPLASLLGGGLIGVAVSIFILINGRIAGISGIVGGLFHPEKGNVAWRVLFIIGLIISPLLYSLFQPLPLVRVDASAGMIIGAGLLVGMGTRFSGGCTSGHGVCGIARISIRSVIATISFILSGMVTVVVMRLFFS